MMLATYCVCLRLSLYIIINKPTNDDVKQPVVDKKMMLTSELAHTRTGVVRRACLRIHYPCVEGEREGEEGCCSSAMTR